MLEKLLGPGASPARDRPAGASGPRANVVLGRAPSMPGAPHDLEALAPDERRRLALHLFDGRKEILARWLASQFDAGRLRAFGVPPEALPPPAILVRTFLHPLLELVRAWVRTGERRYRDVYQDERLRYAPHQASWVVRSQFFDEVLPLDEEALVAAVPAPALREALRVGLRALHAPLRAPAPARPFRLMALGDCLMNEVRVALVARSREEGLPLDFRGQYFSALYGTGLSTDGALAFLREFPADLVALSFLSYKGIAPYAALMSEAERLRAGEVRDRVELVVRTMRDFLSALREKTDAPFLVHDASGLPLTRARQVLPFAPPLSRPRAEILKRLNAAVRELVEHTTNAILLPEAAVAEEHGLRACSERLVPRLVALGGEFHTARLGELLVPSYLDVVHSHRALSRCKVLAVDFDHTLWEGVMADGPVRQRHELQRTLRRLKDAGVVLVAVSKNDPKNIRWAEMTLRPEDFVLQKVTWDLKVRSLQQAAAELDLGLDAFVLLDDNPAERDLVASQLPQVTTLDPNALHAHRWLERMLRFPNTRQTEEARQRTELYRQGVARKAALQPGLDYAGMMASLGLRARVAPAGRSDLDRIAELVGRTNQFNTTTIRYTKGDLAALLASPDHGVYAATLRDKFGDLGLVAAVIVRRSGAERVLESFVMSCRAMGFGLEQLALRRVLDAEGGDGVRFVGRYVRTERNDPCSRLYPTSGFAPQTETEWVLPADAPRPDAPAWFQAS